ncbi:glycosyltransferase family A protein [Roseomonas sp. AR75]|uniref:glycosyltransferase family A protein n=1 Tax=Roseomonas sp. AR75 TaxID=2562311 RepID=UPI0010C124E8|nr:glycosyltransferase family A protein [Roseomonas sp. AR75]
MTRPSIEVVIPAYNAAPFLRATLESIAAQTVLPDRVTVVDDRSTDGTAEVARAAAEALRDRIAIRVLPNAGPQGPSAGRNTAIRASEAELIALLDSDDLFRPNHHAMLLGALQAAPDAVLAFGDNTLFRGEQTILPSMLAESGIAALPAEELAPGLFTLGDRMFAELLRTTPFGTSACLFRRDAALATGLFDETMMYSEDQDFFIRLALRGRFVFTRALVTDKRVHETNLSHARNTLRFCKGSAEAVARLARDGSALTPTQQAAVREVLPRALGGYLYHASRAGPGAWWQAARLAAASGQGALAASPRHLLRAVVSAVR